MELLPSSAVLLMPSLSLPVPTGSIANALELKSTVTPDRSRAGIVEFFCLIKSDGTSAIAVVDRSTASMTIAVNLLLIDYPFWKAAWLFPK